MNFLQTYRRHLIFKLAGIAALILAVLSSAYLFMSVDYARSVRKNTLALNERLTAQTATRIEAYWDSLYNITTAFCYSPTVQQYFSVNSLNRLPDTQELASVFSNTILLNDRILSVYLYNADAKQIASMGKNFSIDTSKLNTDAVMNIRASHLKSNEKRPYYELIFPVYDLNSIQYQKLLGTCVFSWNRKVLMIHFKMPSQRSMPLFFFWIPRTAFLLLPVHRSPAEVRWHLRSCTALPKNIFSLRHFPTMTGKLPVSFRNQIFGNRIRA